MNYEAFGDYIAGVFRGIEVKEFNLECIGDLTYFVNRQPKIFPSLEFMRDRL